MTKVATFNVQAFFRTIDSVRRRKLLSWKDLAQEVGISASTLTRISQGGRPDVDSLAAICAWAGVNPEHFVRRSGEAAVNTLAAVSAHFRKDTNLSEESARAIEEVVATLYERLRKPKV